MIKVMLVPREHFGDLQEFVFKRGYIWNSGYTAKQYLEHYEDEKYMGLEIVDNKQAFRLCGGSTAKRRIRSGVYKRDEIWLPKGYEL